MKGEGMQAGGGRILYFDTPYGISGDMAVASLIDLGVPVDFINSVLHDLPLKGIGIRARKIKRNCITGTIIEVHEGDAPPGLSVERMKGLIDGSGMDEKERSLSTRIIGDLARAEAEVHGVAVEEVHLHELGGVDTLVDAISFALSLSYLGVSEVFSSPLPLGRGEVETGHGILPLPAPAVLSLLKGLPVTSPPCDGELVTPTGAALLKCVVESFTPFPEMILEGTGYGFGHRELEGRTNALRAVIGRPDPEGRSRRKIVVMETNIDDMSPQHLAPLLESIFDRGALDAFITPVIMKKSRPAFLVTILCEPGDREGITETVFRNSSTLGVRYREVIRDELERRIEEIDTSYGRVRVKVSGRRGETFNAAPEYEEILKISRERGLPFRRVWEEIVKSIRDRGF